MGGLLSLTYLTFVVSLKTQPSDEKVAMIVRAEKKKKRDRCPNPIVPTKQSSSNLPETLGWDHRVTVVRTGCPTISGRRRVEEARDSLSLPRQAPVGGSGAVGGKDGLVNGKGTVGDCTTRFIIVS